MQILESLVDVSIILVLYVGVSCLSVCLPVCHFCLVFLCLPSWWINVYTNSSWSDWALSLLRTWASCSHKLDSFNSFTKHCNLMSAKGDDACVSGITQLLRVRFNDEPQTDWSLLEGRWVSLSYLAKVSRFRVSANKYIFLRFVGIPCP